MNGKIYLLPLEIQTGLYWSECLPHNRWLNEHMMTSLGEKRRFTKCQKNIVSTFPVEKNPSHAVNKTYE